MGVQEHIFRLKDIDKRHSVWHVYDVGGARGQRHTWVNYFDDATVSAAQPRFCAPALTFRAFSGHHLHGARVRVRPGTCFRARSPSVPADLRPQWLDEDPRMNRLDDSMKLFETVCAHPVLKGVQLVLFLSTPSPLSRARARPSRVLTPRADKADVLRRKLAKGVRVSK